MTNTRLSLNGIYKTIAGKDILSDIAFSIGAKEIIGLLGPNGAGKTTMFNLIAGLYQPTEGEIILDGEDVTNLTSHQLFHKGLLRTFQIAHEFPTLSVLENLMMVPADQLGESLMNTWLKRKQIHVQERELQKKAEEVIDFLSISHLKNERAGNLSGGQKKLLELARTMMVDAKVVLLDEVGAGVNRTLLNQIGDAILKLNSERGYTFCMIEHDMDFISRLCNPVVVLAEGRILTSGTPDEIKSSDAVIEAYLGKGIKTEATS